MPFKVFTDGSVLTAADVNDYLMEQANTTCTAGTRPPSPVEGQYIHETDTDRRYVYTGSAWRLVGGIGPVAFTPTWTNLTIGNGTQSWSYIYTEGGIVVTGKFTWGTTTAMTGTLQMTAPNSHVAAQYGAGSMHLLDSGTRHYPGTVYIDSGSSTINFVHAETGNAGLVNATNPHTWAVNDTIGCTLLIPLT